MRNTRLYRVILWLLLAASILVLARLLPALTRPDYLPVDDFVQNWAGGRLNLHGQNPFDPQKIEQLQITAGGQASGSYTISIMLNPPWALSLVMPFGLMNYSTSRVAWLLLSIASILISSIWLWEIFSGKPGQRWIAMVVAFIFAPTISVLEVGQITPFVLLGITGFLYFTLKRQNDWLAGVFLALASIKPQLVILFWIALLLWVIQQRRWKVLISAIVTVIILTGIAMAFNFPLFSQYFDMLQTYRISDWANPTFGAYIRYFLTGTSLFWVQFLPSILGILWLIYHWSRRHSPWEWINEAPVLLLVSLLTAPYAWTYDLVILVPVIIQAAVWLSSNWKRWPAVVLTMVFLAINILDLWLHTRLSDFWFIWMVPAILVWYFLVRLNLAGMNLDHQNGNPIQEAVN